MQKKIRLGTRPSTLALKQAKEIIKRFSYLKFDIVAIETEGDRNKITPLSIVESGNFFTNDIEKALIEGRIDIAVHSAKDLEEAIPAELSIVAITRSISPHECLVSKNNVKLSELPEGAVAGTSSEKRKTAIINFRKDLVIKDIRGNIDERLAQLDRGDFDAIIVAHAALLRLGYEDRIAEIIPPHIIEPHPLQGKLALQARRDRLDLAQIFGSINET